MLWARHEHAGVAVAPSSRRLVPHDAARIVTRVDADRAGLVVADRAEGLRARLAFDVPESLVVLCDGRGPGLRHGLPFFVCEDSRLRAIRRVQERCDDAFCLFFSERLFHPAPTMSM